MYKYVCNTSSKGSLFCHQHSEFKVSAHAETSAVIVQKFRVSAHAETAELGVCWVLLFYLGPRSEVEVVSRLLTYCGCAGTNKGTLYKMIFI